jgi:hypothetical protein
MDLHKFPVDTWADLAYFLPFRSILRLYFCGDRQINHIMTKKRVVTEVELVFGAYDTFVAWVPLLAEFQHIRRFVYNMSEMSGSVYYFANQQDLKMLGPALQDLELFADGAEHAFFETAVYKPEDRKSPGVVSEPLRIMDVWPNLVSLNLSQFSTYVRDLQTLGSAMAFFPETLRYFAINYEHEFPIEYISKLPRGLEFLEISSGALSTTCFVDLPPQLLSLNIVLPQAGFIVEHWRDLPQTLTFLKVARASQFAELLPVLPKGLIYLGMEDSLYSKYLPLVQDHFPLLQGLVFCDEGSSDLSDVNENDLRRVRHVKYVSTNNIIFHTWSAPSETWISVKTQNFPWKSPYVKGHVYGGPRPAPETEKG